MTAAHALADLVSPEELRANYIFPPWPISRGGSRPALLRGNDLISFRRIKDGCLKCEAAILSY